MVDPKQEKTIERFIHDFEKVAEIIHAENPDCIIAPMFGAVPFIDMLNIIDDHFPNEKVEYVPASSKVYRLRDVLRGVFESLIHDFTPNGGKLVSIDEVVSGNSVMRMFKQLDAARVNYANRKTVEVFGPDADFRKENVSAYRANLVDSIKYHSIGIVDGKLARQGKPKNAEYEALVQKGIVIPVPTPSILTMDRPEFFPAKYKVVNVEGTGEIRYLPVIEGFCVSPAYVDFLRRVCDEMHKDCSGVTMANMVKIRESYKRVPEGLRKI